MAKAQLEKTEVYYEYRQRAPVQLIEQVIKYLKAKYNGDLNLAVDVGCGSGQNTFCYADHFKKVIGLDIRLAEIEAARDQNVKPNVVFEVSPAETINLKDGSVQLVTVMAASHWFSLPKFFQEVERILSPGGVLALYLYGVERMELKWVKDPRKDAAINNVIKNMAFEVPLADYWTPESQIFFRNYRDITIPYEDFVRDEESIFTETKRSMADLLGELQTWSAFQRLKGAQGTQVAQNFVKDIQQKFMDILIEDLDEDERKSPENIYFVHKNPFVLLMARKASI